MFLKSSDQTEKQRGVYVPFVEGGVEGVTGRKLENKGITKHRELNKQNKTRINSMEACPHSTERNPLN